MNFVKATRDRKEAKQSSQTCFTEQDQTRIAEEASRAYYSRKHARQGLGAQTNTRTGKRPKSSRTTPSISGSESARDKRDKLKDFARQQLEQASSKEHEDDGHSHSFRNSIDKAIGSSHPHTLSEIDKRHSDAIFGNSNSNTEASTRTSGVEVDQCSEHSDESFDFDTIYSSSMSQHNRSNVDDHDSPLYKVLQKGDVVLAYWPRDGQFYEAIVNSVTHGGYVNAKYGVWFTEYQHHHDGLTYEDIQFVSRPSAKMEEIMRASSSQTHETSLETKVHTPATDSNKLQEKGTAAQNEAPSRSNWRARLQQKKQRLH